MGQQSQSADLPSRRAAFWREALLLLLVAMFTSLGACVILQLWNADLHVPLSYVARNPRVPELPSFRSGDSFAYLAWIKATLENGWYLHNPALAAPFGQQMESFPPTENLFYALVWVASWFTQDAALVLNLIYLLGFPAISVAAAFVLRHLGVSRLVAMACAIAYAFLPYRFVPGESHLFLSIYYQIPLFCLVAIWIGSGEPLLQMRAAPRRGIQITHKGYLALAICVLGALSGVYFAAFGLFFMIVASIGRYWQTKQRDTIYVSVLLVAGVIALIAIQLSPSLMRRPAGQSAMTVPREIGDVWLYSLRPVELLIPIPNHRLDALRSFSDRYYRAVPSYLGGQSVYIGLLASMGLIVILAWLIGIRARWQNASLHQLLCRFSLAGILLASSGGLAILGALWVSPVIRSYHRISLYIAFFAIIAAARLLDQLRATTSRSMRPALLAAIAILPAICIFEQTSRYYVPLYSNARASFASDREFVSRIEKALPPGSMIFQMPIARYPEDPRDYELLRGYFHSKQLRWSFGYPRNSRAEQWFGEHGLLSDDPAQLCEAARKAGYSGIWLDRALPPNTLTPLRSAEGSLRELVDPQPMVSEDGRLMFFRMRDNKGPL